MNYMKSQLLSNI